MSVINTRSVAPQIENLLIGDDGLIKLCDFGSATTQMHYPDPSWSAIQRSLLEDEVRSEERGLRSEY